MKKVLIFKMKEVAYASTGVFADALGTELKKCGAQVDFFDIRKKRVEDLENLTESDYDVLIDFNSKLPSLVTDDERPFLNGIRAPFINYIVDHPAYHHANLARPLKRCYVICIDDTHAAYIRKQYPQILGVYAFPLGALAAQVSGSTKKWKEIPFSERSHHILFPGTYLNPNDYYQIIRELPVEMGEPMLGVAERMMAEPALLYEEAVQAELAVRGMAHISFAAAAQALCPADIYVRAWFREQILSRVVQTGLEVTVCGEKYEQSPAASYSNVHIEPPVSYRRGLEMIADSRFVLNVMPWFKSGIHDRVLNAMINGAVSITDSSARMDGYFTPQRDYIAYSIQNLEQIAEIVTSAVSDEKACMEMALRAKEKAAAMTFAAAASEIMRII